MAWPEAAPALWRWLVLGCVQASSIKHLLFRQSAQHADEALFRVDKFRVFLSIRQHDLAKKESCNFEVLENDTKANVEVSERCKIVHIVCYFCLPTVRMDIDSRDPGLSEVALTRLCKRCSRLPRTTYGISK